MNTEKKEGLLNDYIAPQIDDLPVTDEQARQAKGGSLSINFTKISYTYTPYDDKN